MFRSEPMQHGTIVFPADRARDFIELLGKHCHIQLIDMNEKSMVRPYKRYIERIEEMERILRFLFTEINKLPNTNVVPVDPDSFMESELDYELQGVEEALQTLQQHFERFCNNNKHIITEKNAAQEELAVVLTAQASYSQEGSQKLSTTKSDSVIQEKSSEQRMNSTEKFDLEKGAGHFTNIAGVISTEDQEYFSRILFRATRGNAFCHFKSILNDGENMDETKLPQKSVFVGYFQGSPTGESALREKILQLCTVFQVSTYEWPKSYEEANRRATQLKEVISDKTKALEAYEDFFVNEISALLEVHRVGGGSLIEEYRLFCLKEKAIYTTLNFFEGSDTLRAFCWFPEAEEESIRRMLMSYSKPDQASAFLLKDKIRRKQDCPPTYIPTTEFTEIFQSFVNTYGVPRYQEINPAIFTIISFPFLFGVMYGDIGHGACLLVFALALVFMWNKLRRSKDEIVLMIAGGRYMILLMALFAIYAGFLYNDFFALGLNLFGSKYEESHTTDEEIRFELKDTNKIYPFGIDPAWKGAANELEFVNSFKMKLSVIIGGCQMFLGLCLKICNNLFFKDSITLAFETLPQIVFFLCFVGYMDFLILYKWATPIRIPDNKPQIVSNIIEMFRGAEPEIKMFSSQHSIQKVFLILILLCVPVMLLVKPIILIALHRYQIYRDSRLAQGRIQTLESSNILEISPLSGSLLEETADDEEFSVLDIMIHQLIETIEFCLDCLSNTASYLRLWALSLAHQQLALVFFQMTIQTVLAMDINEYVMGICLFFVFIIFGAVTFCVMLCMDALECFLHALRLQWVEFQSKFYKADGYDFVPFRFQQVLQA